MPSRKGHSGSRPSHCRPRSPAWRCRRSRCGRARNHMRTASSSTRESRLRRPGTPRRTRRNGSRTSAGRSRSRSLRFHRSRRSRDCTTRPRTSLTHTPPPHAGASTPRRTSRSGSRTTAGSPRSHWWRGRRNRQSRCCTLGSGTRPSCRPRRRSSVSRPTRTRRSSPGRPSRRARTHWTRRDRSRRCLRGTRCRRHTRRRHTQCRRRCTRRRRRRSCSRWKRGGSRSHSGECRRSCQSPADTCPVGRFPRRTPRPHSRTCTLPRRRHSLPDPLQGLPRSRCSPARRNHGSRPRRRCRCRPARIPCAPRSMCSRHRCNTRCSRRSRRSTVGRTYRRWHARRRLHCTCRRCMHSRRYSRRCGSTPRTHRRRSHADRARRHTPPKRRTARRHTRGCTTRNCHGWSACPPRNRSATCRRSRQSLGCTRTSSREFRTWPRSTRRGRPTARRTRSRSRRSCSRRTPCPRTRRHSAFHRPRRRPSTPPRRTPASWRCT